VTASYDAIVVGLGAMGGATAYHLARRGRRVLGLDRFTPPHAWGSSHGQTRIIREAYFEHPAYVPMVQRAYALWAELERDAGEPLLLQTGGLMIGAPESVLVTGARLSAETHGLQYDVLGPTEIHSRFPALNPEPEMIAIWEPRAGILAPERCVAAHLTLAARAGAELHCDETVLRWEAEGSGVRMVTTRGEYAAEQLVLAAGSWLPSLLSGPGPPLEVERVVLFWFGPSRNAEALAPERCPIHLWQFDGNRFFYGFPDVGQGVKVARHHEGQITSPDAVRREVDPGEVEAMRSLVRRFVPAADGPALATAVCLYTNTPDEHFWIDRLPQAPQVIVASPCSGHGFKFSPVIGEIVAGWVCGDESPFDLGMFRHRSGISAGTAPQ
jgi:sarcosine oxidase